jgi:hypothetical protein
MDIETGNETDAGTLGEIHGERALPLTSPLAASASPRLPSSLSASSSGPSSAGSSPARASGEGRVCEAGPQAPSGLPPLGGAAAGRSQREVRGERLEVRGGGTTACGGIPDAGERRRAIRRAYSPAEEDLARAFLQDRAGRGCGPNAGGVGLGLLSLWLVLGAACLLLGSMLITRVGSDPCRLATAGGGEPRPTVDVSGGAMSSPIQTEACKTPIGHAGDVIALAGKVFPQSAIRNPKSAIPKTEADAPGEAVSSSFPALPRRSDCRPPGAARTDATDQTPGDRRPPALARVFTPLSQLTTQNSQLSLLLDAIRQEESRGASHPPAGDCGSPWGPSLGPYQIGWAYWADAGTGIPYAKVQDATVCRRVIVAYWRRWCPKALQAVSHQRSGISGSALRSGALRYAEQSQRSALETLARFHNGGPGAWKSNDAAAYARRVIARMEVAERERTST